MVEFEVEEREGPGLSHHDPHAPGPAAVCRQIRHRRATSGDPCHRIELPSLQLADIAKPRGLKRPSEVFPLIRLRDARGHCRLVHWSSPVRVRHRTVDRGPGTKCYHCLAASARMATLVSVPRRARRGRGGHGGIQYRSSHVYPLSIGLDFWRPVLRPERGCTPILSTLKWNGVRETSAPSRRSSGFH
jgi:hypothetical protein